MHATDLIARHVPPVELPSLPIEGICCVTGRQALCVNRDDLLSNVFTDWELCQAPSSPHVGINVYRSWMYGWYNKPGSKRMFHPERHACWFVSEDGFHTTDRAEVRGFVLNGCLTPPWAGWVTTNYKKHGSLRTPVNHGTYGRWGFDSTVPDCSDTEKVLSWWSEMRRFQDAGIGRATLETGMMSPGIIAYVGMDIWIEFQAWSKDKLNAVLYRFLAYLLPSRKELEDAGVCSAS